MRFVCGPIPPSRVLDPEAEGWSPLRQWSGRRLTVVALLLGLPLMIAAAILVHDMKVEMRELFRGRPLVGAAYLSALIVMVPVHELIHALAYGRGIRSQHVVFGIWPSRGLCYAILDSPMPKGRVLGMVVAPLLVLTAVPLLCLPYLTGAAWIPVLTFALLHAAICGGDLITFWHLVSQVPSKALVHNSGWQTYWTASARDGAGQSAATNPGA